MKNKILILLMLLTLITACDKKEEQKDKIAATEEKEIQNNNQEELEDEEEYQYRMVLNKTYKADENHYIDMMDDGTFKQTICENNKCIKYSGVSDHADNSFILYYDKINKGNKWEKYSKILECSVIDHNVLLIDNLQYKIPE